MKKLRRLVSIILCLGSSIQLQANDAQNVGAFGRIIPGNRIQKLAAVSPTSSQAIIKNLFVVKAQDVKKGDIIAQLQGIDKAKTTLERAQNSLQVIKTSAKLTIQEQENLIAELEASFAQNARLLSENDPSRREREEIKFNQEALSRKIFQAKTILPLIKLNQEAIIQEAESSLAEVQAIYNEHMVYAPIDGKVIELYTKVGEAVSLDGICEIADTNTMYVEAEVYVSDIQKIKIGDKAIISTDTKPAITDEGSVVEISNYVKANNMFSTDPSDYANLRVVIVKIKLNKADKFQNLIGSQVNVKISK